MSSIYYSRKHASTIILTIIVVVLISLCSKTYAIKNDQQIQDRNRNSGTTKYFLNQGKENIERTEENNNRNSKEVMHAIEVAEQDDEEAATFRFASVKGMIGNKDTQSMRMRKTSGAQKKANKLHSKAGKANNKAGAAQSKIDKKQADKCKKSGKKSGKTSYDTKKRTCVKPPSKGKPSKPTKPTKPGKPAPPPGVSDAECVMCEYVLEAILRKVKSQPPLQQSMSVTDIGGSSKLPEDAYRTYQGPPMFLELKSQVVTAHTHTLRATKGGKAKKAAKKKAKAEKKASKKAAKKGGKKGGKAGKPKPKPKPVPPAPKLPPVVKDKPVPKPPRKPKGLKVGTFTRKQLEQTQIEGEKSAEFEATYKQWMDALDDVCYHDLPATFYHFCKRIYNSGDLMVEMYLHGYEDYEICSAMSCPKNFFETNQ